MMNPRVNGLFITNCANIIATYANCGHGSHGKIDQAIAIIHKIIHTIQQTISIYLPRLINIIHLNNCQNIIE